MRSSLNEKSTSMGKQKAGKKKKTSKVSLVKLSNKKLNKLAKQGKLKKKLPKKALLGLIQNRVDTQDGNDEETSKNETNNLQEFDTPKEEQLEQSDYDYYGKVEDVGFLLNMDSDKTPSRKRKRKFDVNDELERRHEKKALLSRGEEDKVMKALLPIKTKEKGIEMRMVEADPETEAVEAGEDEAADEKKPEEPLPALTTAEIFVQRQQKLKEIKYKIATAATALIQNPVENIRKLKDLRLLLQNNDPEVMVTCKKLCIMSMLEIFKDIIPDYTVRVATQQERQQAAKKETKELRTFEEQLLLHYRDYLEVLEALAKGKAINSRSKKAKSAEEGVNGLEPAPLPEKCARDLKELSIKCMMELLATHPHFNYRRQLVAVVIPHVADRRDTVSSMVCGYVKRIFKEDCVGEVTLEIVRVIAKKVKSMQFNVNPKVLQTLLSLKIKEVSHGANENEKNKENSKGHNKFTSRRDRKRRKQMKELEKELEDAAVIQNKKHKLKLHTETINLVFVTYFRILKQARQSVVLSAVLEGLAKFAHLINVEFFDDLFNVLNELVDSGELSYRERLHCVKTAFIILTGQGSALNIDPLHFYKHLYATLYELTAGVPSEDVETALQCLDIMVTKRRKQIPLQRLTSFIKRLTTLSLQISAEAAVGILASTRNFLLADSKTDILLDTEHQGTGMYLAELHDPEYSNAQSTALYELHLVRHHFHPVVRKLSDHLLSNCSTNINSVLPQTNASSAMDHFNTFKETELNFNSLVPENLKQVKKIFMRGEFLQKELSNDKDKLFAKYDAIDLNKLLFHKGLSMYGNNKRTVIKNRK